MDLINDDVHVWLCRDENITCTSLLKQYQQCLSADEHTRWQQFRLAKHQHQFLVSRALIRSVLSFYHPDIEPALWQFGQNAYGKPHALNNTRLPAVSFNLSHTDGLVVLAITRHSLVGVDVELSTRDNDVLDIARRYFSVNEAKGVQSLATHKRAERFYDLWTLKETYIKARGLGLSIELSAFGFDLGTPGHIQFFPEAEFLDTSTHWQFWLMNLDNRHTLSAALHHADHQSHAELVSYDIVPMGSFTPVSLPVKSTSRAAP